MEGKKQNKRGRFEDLKICSSADGDGMNLTIIIKKADPKFRISLFVSTLSGIIHSIILFLLCLMQLFQDQI
jgi:hypothetical protein